MSRAKLIAIGVVVALVLVGCGHAIGVPHLRWAYTYRGPRSAPMILSGTYVGPTGWRRFDASERPCPLVVFLKPAGCAVWGQSLWRASLPS